MTIPAEQARAFAARFAETLGVAPTRSEFAAVPVERVVEVQQGLSGMGSGAPVDPEALGRRLAKGLLPLGPCVDGDLLPASAISVIREGAAADVPVLVGNTTGEFGMMAADALSGTDQDGLGSALAAMGLPGDRAVHYLSGSLPPPSALAQAITDRTFRIPSVRLAEARATAPTWVYEFGWQSPVMGGVLGAGHCLDLPFVFDDLTASGVVEVAGDHPPQHLADAMHAAWVAFVTDLDPGWAPYSPERRATMVFDDTPHLDDDPLRAVRDTWEGLA
jgi:carboxylesterase type B